MKFTFNIKKMGKKEMSIARSHNCRAHPTLSRLNKKAWFCSEGILNVIEWDNTKVTRAGELAKRKDAVVGIQIFIQVGNQADWREVPSSEYPEGKPKATSLEMLQNMCHAVNEWTEQTFGSENIVGIQAHLDESTPHVHVVVTPIKGEKLQAKAWLDGGATVAILRKSCHSTINARIPCEYTLYGAGTLPHRSGNGTIAEPVRMEELLQENVKLRERIAQLEKMMVTLPI